MSKEIAWKFETKNFTVRLELLEEYETPDWDFDTEQEKQELLNKINDGDLLYFCAKVSVNWEGQEIGSNYLGGCCYESVNDFRKDPYFFGMVAETVKEAREYFKDLTLPKLRAA